MSVSKSSVISSILALGLMLAIGLPSQADSNLQVAGKVVEASGSPAASVWVIVSQDDSEKGRALTGDDGKYSIGRLGAGTYQIVVREGKTVVHQASILLPRDKVHNVRLK
ncbi:MAG: carboxypeptidase-like regulatory domain-containing protein [Acidobacteriota bacterium]